jgi:hypothetical protein
MIVPEPIYEAETIEDDSGFELEPEPPPKKEPPSKRSWGGRDSSAKDRKPCPACGELIITNAAKCRFCGEIFDPKLKRAAKRKKSSSSYASDDEDLSPVEWTLCILCSGIACIMGLVYMIQGKPKGGKMILYSFLIGLILRVISALVIAGLSSH